MEMRKHAVKKLTLAMETLRNLSTQELDQAIGGIRRTSVDGYTCEPTQYTCQI
jgi:hypothetical protein